MDRFLQLSAVAVSTFLCVLLSSQALADGRIGPGAVIPLDITKAANTEVVKEIITSCLYEEAMNGMFPELSNIESAATTTKTVFDRTSSFDKRSRSGSKTIVTKSWQPDFTTELEFDEILDDGSTESRNLTLDFESYYGELSARVDTDFKDLDLSDNLVIPFALAQLQVVSEGGRTCGLNNWGRERCVETPEIVTAVNLLIPADFVSGANWKNTSTDVETRKRFDYFRYAECILWKWQN